MFFLKQQKKLVKSWDRFIQGKLVVKCLQKECDWTGCILDYEVCKANYIFFNVFQKRPK